MRNFDVGRSSRVQCWSWSWKRKGNPSTSQWRTVDTSEALSCKSRERSCRKQQFAAKSADLNEGSRAVMNVRREKKNNEMHAELHLKSAGNKTFSHE